MALDLTPSYEREIRSRWTAPQLVTHEHVLNARHDIAALLTEVDRLRAEHVRRDRVLNHLREMADEVCARLRVAEAALNLSCPTVEPVPSLAANGADRG